MAFSFLVLVLGMEPWASHVLGVLSTTELHLQPSAPCIDDLRDRESQL
jgi:hypothetical protein